MTPEQGQHLAAIAAAGIFVVGVVSMLLWRLEARQNRRRNAPRVEPRRIAAAIEDPTEDHDWDAFLRHLTDGESREQTQPRTDQPAPVRTGGTDATATAQAAEVGDEYEPRLAERAIELPREGRGETP